MILTFPLLSTAQSLPFTSRCTLRDSGHHGDLSKVENGAKVEDVQTLRALRMNRVTLHLVVQKKFHSTGDSGQEERTLESTEG